MEYFVGRPENIETNLRELLPEAQALENKSIYLQILSQIALAQAMQSQFEKAHKTGGKWGIGRALRALNRLDEAFSIQNSMLIECQVIAEKQLLPIELLRIIRGMVYEELAEIHLASVKKYAALAYDDISKDVWFIRLEPNKIERMKYLSEANILP